MAAPAPAKPGGKFAFNKAMLTERKGPLPVWAWLAIGVAVLLVVAWWRRNQRAAADEAAVGYPRDELPGDQGAPPIFVVPPAATPPVNVNVPVTVPTAPPGAGAPPPGGTPAQLPTTAEAAADEDLYAWVVRLNEKHPGLNLDFGKLDLFNPGWRDKFGLYWVPVPGANYKIPKLRSAKTFRIR